MFVNDQLEWLTSLPWPGTTSQDQHLAAQALIRNKSFLDKARAQLDEDHFGLEKIKRRLIEYLAGWIQSVHLVMNCADVAISFTPEVPERTSCNEDSALGNHKCLQSLISVRSSQEPVESQQRTDPSVSITSSSLSPVILICMCAIDW